jgi:hypothetical protein
MLKDEDFSKEYTDEVKQFLKTNKATVLFHNAIYEVKGKVLIELLKASTGIDHECWYMSRESVVMKEFRV